MVIVFNHWNWELNAAEKTETRTWCEPAVSSWEQPSLLNKMQNMYFSLLITAGAIVLKFIPEECILRVCLKKFNPQNILVTSDKNSYIQQCLKKIRQGNNLSTLIYLIRNHIQQRPRSFARLCIWPVCLYSDDVWQMISSEGQRVKNQNQDEQKKKKMRENIQSLVNTWKKQIKIGILLLYLFIRELMPF